MGIKDSLSNLYSNVSGWIFTVLSLIAAVVTIFNVKGTVCVYWKLLVGIGIFNVILLTYLFVGVHNYRKAFSTDISVPLQDVINNGALGNVYIYDNNHMRTNMVVALMIHDGKSNKRMGYGKVTNEVPGDHIEIEIVYIRPEYRNEHRDLLNEKNSVFKRITVSHYVHIADIKEIYNGTAIF